LLNCLLGFSRFDIGLHGRGAEVFESHKAGNPSVGLPGKSHYNASGKRGAEYEFPKEQSRPLVIKGLLIGEVAWYSDPILDGVWFLNDVWKSLAGNPIEGSAK
jgi:hypothetical protein